MFILILNMILMICVHSHRIRRICIVSCHKLAAGATQSLPKILPRWITSHSPTRQAAVPNAHSNMILCVSQISPVHRTTLIRSIIMLGACQSVSIPTAPLCLSVAERACLSVEERAPLCLSVVERVPPCLSVAERAPPCPSVAERVPPCLAAAERVILLISVPCLSVAEGVILSILSTPI